MSRKTKTSLVITALLTLLLSGTATAATTQYTYDNLNRLIRVERSGGATTLYEYDVLGNRTRMVVTTSPGGDCPDCSGDAPVVKDVEFKANTICECKGQTNLTIGPGVKIKKGATVIFKAPKVNVQNGFHAEDGSTVYIKQP